MRSVVGRDGDVRWRAYIRLILARVATREAARFMQRGGARDKGHGAPTKRPAGWWQRLRPFGIGARWSGRPLARPEFGRGCSSGVEHNLAKVGVEGSNPFARSKISSHRRSVRMDRRTFIKAAAGVVGAGAIAAPASAQRGAARVLRFVPQADLANFDPIWNTQYVVRNAAALVWDMLYGFDDKLQPRRQMVESEETSSDGLVWTFRLRPGLKFHDGEPVLAKDVVASLTRWSNRDPMGLMLKAIQNELTAVDDRTFKWVLKQPYPKMLLALGKNSTPCAFIMPERIARTDPFKQISEYVGSGPMKFVRSEWVPGAKSVFEKFTDYAPRQEKASWLAGGKQILV